MRILFDSSILIASFIGAHPKHHAAFPWLQRAKTKEISLIVSAHTLAECFSVLTRLPLSPRILPATAYYLLQENVKKLAEIITLSSQDYLMILKQMTELGLGGGIIYDAITVKAAKKAKVDKILTFNHKDFVRLVSVEESTFILSP